MARNTKASRKGVAPQATSEEGAYGDLEVNETAQEADAPIESDIEEASKAGQSAKPWLSEIELAKGRNKEWHDRGTAVLARFRNEKSASTVRGNHRVERKTNILWANTEVLMSHLCVELGTPDVKRSFQQPGKKTKIARIAAEILEKVMKVENQGFDVTHEFENSVEDHLLPGRGQVWLDLDDAEDENGEMNWVEAKIVHVAWDGFLTGQARKWGEIPWVGRQLLFSRKDLKKSFSKYGAKIPLNYTVESSKENAKKNEETYKRAAVWEIWNKETLERIYVAEDFDKILQVDADPYRLRGFFPCPPALYAVKTTNDLSPVSLYDQYEDQCVELDRLTTRAYRLVETLKYCGVFAWLGNEDAIPDISNLEDGQFLPIKNFQAVAERGGLKDLFMVRDLEQIMVAIKGVYEQRAQLVQTIYEITGLADIMRGQSDPRETATAQKIKSRFGSNRTSRRQRDVQRFVRDAYRLKAELIAEHYSREQLQEMTGIMIPTKEDQDKAKVALTQLKQAQQNAVQAAQAMQAQSSPGMPQRAPMPPPMPPQMPKVDPDSMADIQGILAATPWEDIQKVLRSNVRRLFMVDIETDDTAFEDEQGNKDSALEFMRVFFDTMDKAVIAVKSNPVLLPLAKEAVLFTVDAFKVGQAFEDVINDTFDKLGQQPPQQQPDPKAIAAQAAAKANEAKAQTEQMRLSNEQAQKQQDEKRFQIELSQQAEQTQQDRERHQSEMQGRAQDIQFKKEEQAVESQRAAIEIAQEHAELALKQHFPRLQTGMVAS